jgi:uncharacterized membrane protein YeaQ/YmgE (transglycosylase-associated protein family)
VTAGEQGKESDMSWLAWIVLGLLAGLIAKWIMPGKDPGGFLLTIVIGVVGALLGGFLATQLGFGGVSGLDWRSLVIAVLGSMLLLFIYRIVKK